MVQFWKEVSSMSLKTLVGSGDKIAIATLPVVAAGLILNVAFPSFFSVGGPPSWLAAISIAVSVVGVTIWLWSVALILSKVPHHELIETGPFRLMKHPIYTSVSLLVIPWVGFLLNTWLGVVIGVVMYMATRRFGPEEERYLAETFGPEWDAYRRMVFFPWV
jgi:protein-S-isoprenylcysteine O-methyltransferase Ste14